MRNVMLMVEFRQYGALSAFDTGLRLRRDVSSNKSRCKLMNEKNVPFSTHISLVYLDMMRTCSIDSQ